MPPDSSLRNSTTTTKIVVATTVALSFISFWRGAAIVLSDLASSAFYAGGIAEQAVGQAAPWFVLAVMLFSFAVRSVYMESCSMFVRGGVYVVVRDAWGRSSPRLSVSSLVFDYILTGPISVVSAGQYLGRLSNEISAHAASDDARSTRTGSRLSSACWSPIYFWWRNIKGMHESSGKALRIMQITTVMVVILLIWCPLTMLLHGPVQIPASAAAAQSAFQPGRARVVQGHVLADDSDRRDDHRVRAFAALHERLRDAGAGVSRDRLSEAEEPEALRGISSASTRWFAPA